MRAYLKMRLFLPFKNLNDSSLVTSFLSSSQKGAASLVVVALLLAGITAAVYLTQTGTSFLPQAQEAWTTPNDDKIRVRWDQNCHTDGTLRNYQIRKGQQEIAFNEALCNTQHRPCSDAIKAQCGKLNLQCKAYDEFQAECVSPARTPSQEVTKCVVKNSAIDNPPKSSCPSEGQQYLISHCDFTPNPDYRILGDDCLNLVKPQDYTYYCYWNKQCSNSPQSPVVAPAAAAATAQGSTVQDSPCTNPTHIAHCQNTRGEHGTNATGKCFLLNKDPNQPKCEYTTDFKPTSGATGPCNTRDNNACSNGCELIKIKLASDGREVQYSRCKTASAPAPAAQPAAPRPAAGAPAAPQSNTGQRPQSAQAPSTTKTPWDKDADGDSKLISQVFALAAKDLSKSYDNAKDGIDAAKKARTAYENQFKKAYSDIFKADISKDADALAVLSRELNNVAVHAYISKEHPGMSWETAKSTGKVEAAISNLKRPEVGVISQNSQITASNVSTPGSAPSASAPRRLTIDPTVAVNCGTDLDGTQIPCYQIGVFASFDDLKATEAQASIATQRYAKSQEILTAAKGKVDEAILAAAQAKLDAAKAKAAACMPK